VDVELVKDWLQQCEGDTERGTILGSGYDTSFIVISRYCPISESGEIDHLNLLIVKRLNTE